MTNHDKIVKFLEELTALTIKHRMEIFASNDDMCDLWEHMEPVKGAYTFDRNLGLRFVEDDVP